jgi:SM-20-related protein
MPAMIDLLEVEEFFEPELVDALVAELDASSGSASTVLGARPEGVVHGARKSTRVAVSPETSERVWQELMSFKPAFEEHFGVKLSACEKPQFLRYDVGDYFVAHQDGNTPAVHDESRFRRVSIVIFLSEKSETPAEGTYGGGELVFHGPYTGPPQREAAGAQRGSLVAFRSETTHEVLPVTHGVRYTVATWFRA